jgi:hypothetical protein
MCHTKNKREIRGPGAHHIWEIPPSRCFQSWIRRPHRVKGKQELQSLEICRTCRASRGIRHPLLTNARWPEGLIGDKFRTGDPPKETVAQRTDARAGEQLNLGSSS